LHQITDPIAEFKMSPRRKIHRAAFALSLCLLTTAAGCSLFERGPSPSSFTYDEFESRTLDNSRLREFIESYLHHGISQWPPEQWDLPTLILAAYYYHPDLDSARAKWAEAKAAVTTAARRPNPIADSRYQYVTNAEPGTKSSIVDSNLIFPIEALGKRRNRISQAEHLSEEARLGIERTAWQVGSRVRDSLINLSESKETLALLKKQVSLQLENNSYIEEGTYRGEFSPLEATTARLSLGDARLLLAQGEKQLSDSRVQLADALSIPSAEVQKISITFDFPYDPLPDISYRDLKIRALKGRSDLKASLSDYSAARAALQMELASRYPDIQIGPGFEFDQGLDKWGISGALPLPIFDRNQGPIAEARARMEAAAARCGALQAQIIGELEASLAAYSSAREELNAANDVLEDRERNLDFIEAMTRPGELKRLAVYEANLLVNNAVIARLSALFKVKKAVASMEDAVQASISPRVWTSSAWERKPRGSVR